MSEVNPWKTLNSRTIYENDWIRLREDSVIRPDGAPGIYGVVETRVATGVVALTPKREIYLVGQYRYPTEMYSWEIIEGGADKDEDPLAAAKRELAEEAGLIAKHWEQLGLELHLSNCYSAEVGMLYIAQELVETERKPDGTEVLAVKKISFETALKMVDDGEIKDSLSIIGILRAARLIERGLLK